jgi:2-iminobutanoate/2-iminopropanoate deaminase
VPRFEAIESATVRSTAGRPYSPGLRCGDWLMISGQVGVGPGGETVAGGAGAQWRQSLENLRSVVEQAGGDMEDVVRVDVFVTDMRHYLEHEHIRREHFRPPYPLCTAVAVEGLPHEDWLIEIDGLAYLGR